LYWLRPPDIGALVGISVSQQNREGRLLSNDIDKALMKLGVECNRYKGEYTGVSLERYRRLIRLLGHEYKAITKQQQRINNNTSILSTLSDGYGLAAIAWLVWEKASSKGDLLDYLTELNNHSGLNILTDSAAQALGTSQGRNDWIATELFVESELQLPFVQSAIERLLLSHHKEEDKEENEKPSFGEALEIVAASLSLETSVKPALKLGRYTLSTSSSLTNELNPATSTAATSATVSMKALKPDCVEVTIREILEAFIYGQCFYYTI